MPRGRPRTRSIDPTITFQPLPQEINKNGYRYTLMDRTIKAAIYKAVNVKYPEDTSICWEVFKVITTPAVTLKPASGKEYTYPAGEKFPGNEDFGKIAWTYDSETSARVKFNEIK